MTERATMDFFEHQDRARKKTSVLIGYFVVAVALIAVAVYFAVAAIIFAGEAQMSDPNSPPQLMLWRPELFLGVFIGTLSVVLLGSLYKVAQLGHGGEVVARMLGGVKINQNTTSGDERKILNVVEEMAIASGTPVPPVFIMEESGINAFAAGFSPSDAVIGVTRGCIQQLDRDELQGVIAHEFSHILNGDMKLNIRLMGVLHGILVISLIGYWLMRSSMYARGSRNSKDSGGGRMAMILLGLALMIIGYVGVIFGKLIKAAVSRQREFLADASAVQFTRNPKGIAGALKKIAGFKGGSKLASPNAESASHLFFANGLASSFMSAFATHPPLPERIGRIDREFEYEKTRGAATPPPPPSSAAGISGFAAGGSEKFAVHSSDVVSSVGTMTQEHVDYAAGLIAAIPHPVIEAAREPFGARAVIYCLLLDDDSSVRKSQLSRLEQHADQAVYTETLQLAKSVQNMAQEAALPLLDMAIPTLKNLSPSQYEAFKENIGVLVAADDEIDLFEYSLQRSIKRHLEPAFVKTSPPKVKYKSMPPLKPACTDLLSSLAYWGSDNADSVKNAFSLGAAKLELPADSLRAASECGLGKVDNAIEMISHASPALKKRIIDACVSCIAADGEITTTEAELVRAVADSLGCPIPPFLPGKMAA